VVEAVPRSRISGGADRQQTQRFDTNAEDPPAVLDAADMVLSMAAVNPIGDA
jgi:hypothetical protein